MQMLLQRWICDNAKHLLFLEELFYSHRSAAVIHFVYFLTAVSTFTGLMSAIHGQTQQMELLTFHISVYNLHVFNKL
jgi:hypothetical protein